MGRISSTIRNRFRVRIRVRISFRVRIRLRQVKDPSDDAHPTTSPHLTHMQGRIVRHAS